MGGIARDGARYRIGPLTTYDDPQDLEAWHRKARHGDERWYAFGPALGAEAVTAKLARKLYERGEAFLFQKREGNGYRYFIRKLAKSDDRAARSRDPSLPQGLDRQLLDALMQLIDEGLPLPSFELLADYAGLSDRHAARYRLQNLESQGHVRIVTANGGARVAEIVATGQRTAEIVKQQRA
ncbi:hypothetical protein [Novosphingobium sp. KN65.2]|uniref:hypothetical protein n=1 Tax=Novosphingobium sp. KN65.2 TaxID=1478134 RepID=UPI000B1D3E3D|nr:hypothetical protein [Novosphingobium sp. KN65.2]